MKKLLLVVMFLVLMPLKAMAYDGWSGKVGVDSIRVYTDDFILITIPSTANPGGCSDNTYLALQNAESAAGLRKYTALLSAFTHGKSVNIAMTGCSSGGTAGWPVIDQVWLVK